VDGLVACQAPARQQARPAALVEINDFEENQMAKNHSFAIEFDRLMLELNMMLTNMHEYIVMNLIYESLE
jgi:hypothetical protein